METDIVFVFVLIKNSKKKIHVVTLQNLTFFHPKMMQNANYCTQLELWCLGSEKLELTSVYRWVVRVSSMG